MNRFAISAAILILAGTAAAADDDDDDGSGGDPGSPTEINVDCDSGETITDALATGDPGSPLTITIRGTCVENVSITRDDVTLRGIDPSMSRVSGAPDPGLDGNPIVILGAERTIIENLTVSDGAGVSGIGATTGFFTVRDCVIENNQRAGVLVGQGAHGRIGSSVIRDNGQDGVIAFGGGFARVWNSEIRDNGTNGVHLLSGASGAIGIAPPNEPGPNVIVSNGRNGVQVTGSSHARIDLNTFDSNGVNGIGVFNGSAADIEGNSLVSNGQNGIDVFGGSSASITDNVIEDSERRGIQIAGGSYGSVEGNRIVASGRQAIGVFNGSSADVRGNLMTGNNTSGDVLAGGVLAFAGDVQINGGNEIRENTGTGVRVVHGTLSLNADPVPDVIELNSHLGVQAQRGSTLTINAGEIRQNGFGGIEVRGQSYVVIRETDIVGNSDFGIRLELDSGIRFRDPPANITGHAFFDLECSDIESSVVGDISGVGSIDPACSGF